MCVCMCKAIFISSPRCWLVEPLSRAKLCQPYVHGNCLQDGPQSKNPPPFALDRAFEGVKLCTLCRLEGCCARKCPHKVRKVWEENYIAIMLEVIRKLCEAGFLAIFKRSIFFCFILNMRKHFLNKSIVTTIILKCLFILLLKLQDLNF